VGFYTECGSILQNLSPKGLHGIFERFRGILHEGEIDKQVQFLIEGLFAIRKAKFQGYPAEDHHKISLDEEIDPEISLDIFKPDPNFLEKEKRYEEMQTKDETQTNLVNLLRKIYLTIMSSVDFEEAGHELLKIKLKPDQEMELCIMQQLVQRKETQHVLMKVTVRMTEEEESGGESVMQFYAIVEGPCIHKT
ncbi:hypothetical protein GYH30_044807, partial [Glycine max]